MKTFWGMEDNFYRHVYEVVRLIPRGKVTTYGAIAAYLGVKSGARMVGWAMNTSHRDQGIPAHRVVNRVGLLTGKNFFSEPDTMQRKLEEEGIKVRDDEVQNFDQVFWDPAKELQL